jgi:hypothetical protein
LKRRLLLDHNGAPAGTSRVPLDYRFTLPMNDKTPGSR